MLYATSPSTQYAIRTSIILFIIFLASCSPKTTPVRTPPPKKPDVVTTPPPVKTTPVPVTKHVNSIALILPFQLDKITTKSVQSRDVTRAALALDFYQGFKLALDSLAAQGNDFKLTVLDSRDNNTQAAALAKSAAVMASDLVVGPVLPDGIKAFGIAADLKTKLLVSPLAAAMPTQFNNPKLVTLNNSIDQHAWKLADFINKKYPPSTVNVLIINTRKPADEQYGAPVRKYLTSFSKSKLTFAEFSTAAAIEPRLSRTKTNIIIMTSPEREFVSSAVNVLFKYAMDGYRIELYGHPNWAKIDGLDIAKLQDLDTRLTSSYYVDFKSYKVEAFADRYKKLYKQVPSEYAVNGFDTGYFFGSMLAKYGVDYVKSMATEKYEGLHNDFEFTYNPATGYANTQLLMLKFRGFELEPD